MALPLIPLAVGAFASIIQFIIRHPLVTKMLFFAVFTGLLTTAINYILNLLSPYVLDNQALVLASYFGVLNALSLYVSIVISGWGVKQVIAYARS